MNLGWLVKLLFWLFFWLQVFPTNCNWFSKCSLKVSHVTRNMDLLQTIKTFSITNSINSYWHALFSSLTKKKMFLVATLVLHNLITSGLPHTFSYIFSHMDYNVGFLAVCTLNGFFGACHERYINYPSGLLLTFFWLMQQCGVNQDISGPECLHDLASRADLKPFSDGTQIMLDNFCLSNYSIHIY